MKIASTDIAEAIVQFGNRNNVDAVGNMFIVAIVSAARKMASIQVAVIRKGLAVYLEINVAIVVVIRRYLEISFLVRQGDSVVIVVSCEIVCNRR